MRFIVPLVILLTTSWVAWGGRVTMDPNGPLSRTVKETLDPCPGYVPGDSPLVGIEETIRNTLDPCYGMVPIGEGNPDPDPPTVPSSLSVVPDGNTLGVQGVPSDDATFLGYRWCEGAGCTSFTNEVNVISMNVVYQIENLEWDTTYEVQARSEGQYGNSPWTSSVAGVIGSEPNPPDGPPTEAPGIPTLVASTTDTTLTITVPADDQYTDYDFRICEGAGCTSFTQQSRDTDSPHTFTGLTPGETYGYWARAKNSVGNSGYTSYQYTSTTGGNPDPDPEDAPPAPTSFSAIPFSSSVNLSWVSGGGTTASYGVSHCEGASCSNFGAIAPVSGTSTNVGSLTASTTYSFRVYAYNSDGLVSPGYLSGNATTTEANPPLTACTDGVDCRCDTINDPDMIFCEDFESPALAAYEVSTDGGASDKGSSGWFDTYPGQVAGCFDSSEGSHNVQGPEGYKCVWIVDSNCTGTSDTNCVPDGGHSLAERYMVGENMGITGSAIWDEPTDQFGVTYLWKYDDDYVQNGTQPRKTAEFRDAAQTGNHCLLGCNTTSTDKYAPWYEPNPIEHPFDRPIMPGSFSVGIPFSSSDNGADAGTMVVGQGQSFTTTYQIVPDRNVWPAISTNGNGPPDGWTCQQLHISGWGSTDATIRGWFNGVLAYEVDGVDMSGLRNGTDPMAGHVWNSYANGGYTGSEDGFRYTDNFIVTKGSEPVSCEDAGFANP